MDSAEMGVLAGFLVVYFIFLAFLLAFAAVAYVLQSIGFHTLAKKSGIENPWLAWIPVANFYIIGALAEKSNAFYGKKSRKFQILLPALYGVYMLLMPILSGIMSAAGAMMEMNGAEGVFILFLLLFYGVFFAFSIAVSVLWYVAVYKVFKLFDPDRAVLYILLSIFVSVSYPIIVFILRKREFPVRQESPYGNGGYGAPPAGGMYPPQQGFAPNPMPGNGAPMQGGFAQQPAANPAPQAGYYPPQPVANPAPYGAPDQQPVANPDPAPYGGTEAPSDTDPRAF